MILPTKHLRADRSLIAVGAEVLSMLEETKTVSRLWDEFCHGRSRSDGRAPVSYEWFVLALDLLFIIGAVSFSGGRVLRNAP